MPNKKKFIIHGVLLGLYLLFTIAAVVVEYYFGEDCKKICHYSTALFGLFTNTIEQITCVFVLYSQVPYTSAQKDQAMKLKNVLLQGFAKVEDIEPAVMEQHQDLPEDERQEMRQQLGEFRSFYNNNSEDCLPLFASLVIVPEVVQYGFEFKFPKKGLETNDERCTEVEEVPMLLTSLDWSGRDC